MSSIIWHLWCCTEPCQKVDSGTPIKCQTVCSSPVKGIYTCQRARGSRWFCRGLLCRAGKHTAWRSCSEAGHSSHRNPATALSLRYAVSVVPRQWPPWQLDCSVCSTTCCNCRLNVSILLCLWLSDLLLSHGTADQVKAPSWLPPQHQGKQTGHS